MPNPRDRATIRHRVTDRHKVDPETPAAQELAAALREFIDSPDTVALTPEGQPDPPAHPDFAICYWFNHNIENRAITIADQRDPREGNIGIRDFRIPHEPGYLPTLAVIFAAALAQEFPGCTHAIYLKRAEAATVIEAAARFSAADLRAPDVVQLIATIRRQLSDHGGPPIEQPPTLPPAFRLQTT